MKRPRPKIIYDGECGFCSSCIKVLQMMDWWGKLDYVSGPKGMSEMRLEFPDGKVYGGFFAFRKLVWMLPVLYPMILVVYFPGSGLLGPFVYRWIAQNRYIVPVSHSCSKEKCRL